MGKLLHSRGGSINNTSTCYCTWGIGILKLGNNQRKIENSGNQLVPVHLGSKLLPWHSGALGQWGAVTETGNRWHQQ